MILLILNMPTKQLEVHFFLLPRLPCYLHFVKIEKDDIYLIII